MGACVHACVRACMRACVCVHVYVRACVCTHLAGNIHLLTSYSYCLSVHAYPSVGCGHALVLSSVGCPYKAEFQCACVSHSAVISHGMLGATTADNTIRACPLH